MNNNNKQHQDVEQWLGRFRTALPTAASSAGIRTAARAAWMDPAGIGGPCPAWIRALRRPLLALAAACVFAVLGGWLANGMATSAGPSFGWTGAWQPGQPIVGNPAYPAPAAPPVDEIRAARRYFLDDPSRRGDAPVAGRGEGHSRMDRQNRTPCAS